MVQVVEEVCDALIVLWHSTLVRLLNESLDEVVKRLPTSVHVLAEGLGAAAAAFAAGVRALLDAIQQCQNSVYPLEEMQQDGRPLPRPAGLGPAEDVDLCLGELSSQELERVVDIDLSGLVMDLPLGKSSLGLFAPEHKVLEMVGDRVCGQQPVITPAGCAVGQLVAVGLFRSAPLHDLRLVRPDDAEGLEHVCDCVQLDIVVVLIASVCMPHSIHPFISSRVCCGSPSSEGIIP